MMRKPSFLLFASALAAGCSKSPPDSNGNAGAPTIQLTDPSTVSKDSQAGSDIDADEPVCEVDTTYNPVIDPAKFVAKVDNPLFPLIPGTVFHHEADDETSEVTVTTDHRTLLGVSTTVVHDVVSVNGEIIEDTLDYYAQDVDGAVWYFGEDTKQLENGVVVGAEGSWLAGVDDAKPGLIIPAKPTVGLQYRQEYSACIAEDSGEIVSTCTQVDVELGHFTRCLETLDTTALEPTAAENKYYCPGVGNVLTVDLETGDREELVEVERP